jgi:hypothetical protein
MPGHHERQTNMRRRACASTIGAIDMLHPDTELRKRNDCIGYGVFATSPIPLGTITWVLDPLDQILDDSRLSHFDSRLLETVIKYSTINGRGQRVLCWDMNRFMNHSCEANVLSPGMPLEIAVRDIAAGEELTNDYGAFNIETDFRCLCGARTCRGIVRNDDFERLAPHWDERLRHATARAHWVAQPLAHWLHEEHGLLDRFRFPDPLPSILAHRWRVEGSEATSAGPAQPT